MTSATIVALIAGGLACFLLVLLLMRLPVTGRAISPTLVRQQMRALVAAQQEEYGDPKKDSVSITETAAQELAIERVADTQLTIRKRLKFAQLSEIPPYAFSLAQIAVSLILFLIVRQFFDAVLQVIALLSGPLFLNWLINLRIDRRFKQFDADFPQFLLSFVGMLKTGLNPIQALQAAASGLEETSLVRVEVELMLERLRMGVSEERSIGSFGEDIFHPEIELFVQALILSRRVGGNLSDTIDRLARQVRRRQYFRQSAQAAVGMQRGSIWFILAVLGGMELYMYLIFPDAVVKPWVHPKGRTICQAGLTGIILGIFWVRQVTKLRV